MHERILIKLPVSRTGASGPSAQLRGKDDSHCTAGGTTSGKPADLMEKIKATEMLPVISTQLVNMSKIAWNHWAGDHPWLCCDRFSRRSQFVEVDTVSGSDSIMSFLD